MKIKQDGINRRESTAEERCVILDTVRKKTMQNETEKRELFSFLKLIYLF